MYDVGITHTGVVPGRGAINTSLRGRLLNSSAGVVINVFYICDRAREVQFSWSDLLASSVISLLLTSFARRQSILQLDATSHCTVKRCEVKDCTAVRTRHSTHRDVRVKLTKAQ